MNTLLSSKLVENAVNEIAKLPGIGRRSALRMVLHLLKQDIESVNALGEAIVELRKNIVYCKSCFNISDNETCEICANPQRDHTTICIVEDIRDVIAIENTNQFKGLYHVLGGIISPIDGIGPSDLTIQPLIDKISAGNVNEIIIALKGTMEGETTSYFLYKKISPFSISVSIIARGIGISDDLEYTDELSLGRSIVNRIPYSKILVNH